MKGRLSEVSGYERRREISSFGLNQVQWLFNRHILREPTEQISAQVGRDVTIVDAAIKDLRSLLDL